MSKNGELFQRVINNNRSEVMKYLCKKYVGLKMQDSEDIVQEASLVVWNLLVANKVKAAELDLVKMWMAVCRYKYTHWLEKRKKKPMICVEEETLGRACDKRGIGRDSGNDAMRDNMEKMFAWINKQNDNNKKLFQMVLADKPMAEICVALNLRSEQNARNKKCNLLKRMRKDLVGMAA